MLTHLYAALAGAFAAWAATRFAVARGWYLAHCGQIASTVAEAKAMRTLASKDAQSVAASVKEAVKEA
jgi:hypothetical protein